MAFKGHIELVRGQGDFPATDLDFRTFFTAADQLTAALEGAVNAAIDEETQPIQVAGGEDNELVRLITDQVQPREPEGKDATYHVRVVYEYDPECPPLGQPGGQPSVSACGLFRSRRARPPVEAGSAEHETAGPAQVRPWRRHRDGA